MRQISPKVIVLFPTPTTINVLLIAALCFFLFQVVILSIASNAS